jgi:hypothetical protein
VGRTQRHQDPFSAEHLTDDARRIDDVTTVNGHVDGAVGDSSQQVGRPHPAHVESDVRSVSK